MSASIDYYRTYNEKNRELINAKSRLRYAIKSGHARIAPPDVAKERCTIYAAALEEIADPEVRATLNSMLDGMVALFMENGLKQIAAEHQALEFIAACVWNKATG